MAFVIKYLSTLQGVIYLSPWRIADMQMWDICSSYKFVVLNKYMSEYM